MKEKKSNILSQKITVVILCTMVGLIFLLMPGQAKATEERQRLSVEMIPEGETAEDEEGNLWAKRFSIFITERENITFDIEKGLRLETVDGREQIDMMLQHSDENKIAVACASVSQNGCYKIKNMNADEEYIADVIIERIDQTPPELTVLQTPKQWIEGNVKLQVFAKDAGCGLASDAYSFDGGESFSDNNCYYAREEGEVLLAVRDKLGNVTEEKITLAKQPIVIVSENKVENKTKNKTERQEKENRTGNNNARDLSGEDVVEPAISKQAIFENSYLEMSAEKTTEQVEENRSIENREAEMAETKTSVIEKAENHEQEAAIEDSAQTLKETKTKQTKRYEVWKHPIVRRAVQISCSIFVIVSFLGLIVLILTRIYRVALIASPKKEQEKIVGYVYLSRKEHKHTLCIPENFLLKAEDNNFCLKPSWPFTILANGQALYISYSGKTTELKIAREMPFII